MAAAPEPPVDPSAALLARWQEAGDREALDGLLRLEIEILKHRLRAQQGGRLSPSLSASDACTDASLRATPSDSLPLLVASLSTVGSAGIGWLRLRTVRSYRTDFRAGRKSRLYPWPPE